MSSAAVAQSRRRTLPGLLAVLAVLGWSAAARPAVEHELRGQLKTFAGAAFPASDAQFAPAGTRTYFDASSTLRLMHTSYLRQGIRLDTHYELTAAGGDTRRKTADLLRRLPPGLPVPASGTVADDRRLFSLTRELRTDDAHTVTQRLDRLVLTLQPAWGTIRLGRQAVSWGNGFLFNPMDLFNPFAPTDVVRDYKAGDDMLSLQTGLGAMGDVHLLWVPRRDPSDGAIAWDRSSLAGRLHLLHDALEGDLMLARHYGEAVIGLGISGYLGQATWRTDATWTVPDGAGIGEGVVAVVANLDHAWTWGGKNLYGTIEAYFNDLGAHEPLKALQDPAMAERLARGELYTLGRWYADVMLRVELHPLVNLASSLILDLQRGSWIAQPRLMWDVRQNLSATVGAVLYGGPDGSEFGGIRVPLVDLRLESSDSVYAWLTWFF